MSLDINLTNVESTTNKSTNVNTDQASNTKYPSVKAVFDWATSLFIKKSDYTPAHSILAQQSGTGTPTAVTIGTDEILGRLSGGGSDIEGLSTSQVKTLLSYTTADIADSTNKRYVTDANLVVLGNTSNTNTGDETQASILSKLGIWNIQDQTAGTVSSGTTQTITKSIELPSVPSFLNFRAVFFKTGSNGTYTVRAYLSEVDNNIGGTAVQIALVTGANVAANHLPMKRTFDIISGNIIGLQAGNSQVTDDINSSSIRLNVAIPTGTPLYLIFTVQCANASDSAQFESAQINNFSF